VVHRDLKFMACGYAETCIKNIIIN